MRWSITIFVAQTGSGTVRSINDIFKIINIVDMQPTKCSDIGSDQITHIWFALKIDVQYTKINGK